MFRDICRSASEVIAPSIMKVLGIIALCLISRTVCNKIDQILTVEKMINCPDRVARNPNFFSKYNYARNITYRKYKLVQVPSGYIYINTGVKKLKTTIVLKRCNSKYESSCENFLKMKYNDLCKMMEDKDQVYTPFAEAFHPPIRCPLVKGTLYTITNATIDASGGLRLLKHVPNVLNDYWALRFEGSSNNVEVWCLELWLKFYEIKKRNA